MPNLNNLFQSYLQELLEDLLPPSSVIWLSEVDSTNRFVLEQRTVITGYGVVGATFQSAGRGRRLRPWVSSEEGSLTFSIQIPAYRASEMQNLGSLPLRLGFATAQAIEQWFETAVFKSEELLDSSYRPSIQLKWPNDLLINNGKVAGLLVESRQFLVAGIGLNLSPPKGVEVRTSEGVFKSIKPSGLFLAATHLTVEQRMQLVAVIVKAIIGADIQHRIEGFAPLAKQWEARHAMRGQEVLVMEEGHNPLRGIVMGLSELGELMLQTKDRGIQKILNGDVSVRAVDDN